eukprot:gene11258-15106_t
MLFNPGNVRFRRGTQIITYPMCMISTTIVVLADWGPTEHIFTPLQKYIYRHVDAYFNITAAELSAPPKKEDPSKPWIQMKRVEKNREK